MIFEQEQMDDCTKLSFFISNENLQIFLSKLKEIESLLESKNSISFELANEVYNIARIPKMIYFNDAQKNRFNKALANSVAYFSLPANKGYFLNGSKLVDEKYTFIYNLNTLFYSVLLYVLQIRNSDEESSTPKDLENIFLALFKELKIYRDAHFNNKEKKQFTYYRLCVMAAYLCTQLGYKITQDNNPPNVKLFQASRKYKAPKFIS